MSIVRNIITGVVGVGIVSAGVWALDNTKRDESGTIVEAGELGVFNFAVGDCITDLPDTGEIDKATGVPCGESHEYEVYAETFIDSDSEEVPADMSDQADVFCYGEFTKFVGLTYEESTLEFMTLFPSPESWKGGDQEISCLISEANAITITESLKNAQR
jgi:hypothetical protein